MHISCLIGSQHCIQCSQSQNSLGNPEKLLWDLRSSPSLDLLLSIKEKIPSTKKPINLQDNQIDFSVPQGSILGPILFNCYASMLMEIIPESKDSFLSGYADDHAMIHSLSPDNENIKQNIENDIGKIKTWMEENQLKMDDAKTEFIDSNCLQ